MPIRGRITTSYAFDRPYERLGDAMVPGKVGLSLAGELGEPDAAVQFEIRDGRPDCVEFIVKAKPEGRGLRSSDLAMLNIDAIAERAFLDFSAKPDGGALGGDDAGERWELRGSIGEAIKAPGRGPSKAELAEVARIYRDHPSAPANAVEKMLGLSRRTASRRVKQARDAGMLP